MRQPPHEAERFRLRQYSTRDDGNNGPFMIPCNGVILRVIASDGMGWDHVSVTVHEEKRCPTWEEMDFIKRLFWQPSETVIQYHVRRDANINVHPYCLHMWKPQGKRVPMPKPEMIG